MKNLKFNVAYIYLLIFVTIVSFILGHNIPSDTFTLIGYISFGALGLLAIILFIVGLINNSKK
jgi:hypothetical protein